MTNSILTLPYVQKYIKSTEEFIYDTSDNNIHINPMIKKFNNAWEETKDELFQRDKNVYMTFVRSDIYFKKISDVRKFIEMLRPDKYQLLQKYFKNREVKESLGFYGSGQHAYIKYLTKAMIIFMKNYYGEEDYQDQVYRMWGIYE